MKVSLINLISFGLIASVLGCSTTSYWVEKRYKPRGGTVAYRNEGWGIEGRAADSKAKMAEFCGAGGYELIAERSDVQSQGAIATPIYGTGQVIATPVEEGHLQLVFECK